MFPSIACRIFLQSTHQYHLHSLSLRFNTKSQKQLHIPHKFVHNQTTDRHFRTIHIPLCDPETKKFRSITKRARVFHSTSKPRAAIMANCLPSTLSVSLRLLENGVVAKQYSCSPLVAVDRQHFSPFDRRFPSNKNSYRLSSLTATTTTTATTNNGVQNSRINGRKKEKKYNKKLLKKKKKKKTIQTQTSTGEGGRVSRSQNGAFPESINTYCFFSKEVSSFHI